MLLGITTVPNGVLHLETYVIMILRFLVETPLKAEHKNVRLMIFHFR